MGRRVSCPICGLELDRGSLARHKRNQHERDPSRILYCEYREYGCKFRTPNESNLKEHIFTHTNEMPYSCSHCGQRFNQSSGEIHHRAVCPPTTERDKITPNRPGKRRNPSGRSRSSLASAGARMRPSTPANTDTRAQPPQMVPQPVHPTAQQHVLPSNGFNPANANFHQVLEDQRQATWQYFANVIIFAGIPCDDQVLEWAVRQYMGYSATTHDILRFCCAHPRFPAPDGYLSRNWSNTEGVPQPSGDIPLLRPLPAEQTTSLAIQDRILPMQATLPNEIRNHLLSIARDRMIMESESYPPEHIPPNTSSFFEMGFAPYPFQPLSTPISRTASNGSFPSTSSSSSSSSSFHINRARRSAYPYSPASPSPSSYRRTRSRPSATLQNQFGQSSFNDRFNALVSRSGPSNPPYTHSLSQADLQAGPLRQSDSSVYSSTSENSPFDWNDPDDFFGSSME